MLAPEPAFTASATEAQAMVPYDNRQRDQKLGQFGLTLGITQQESLYHRMGNETLRWQAMYRSLHLRMLPQLFPCVRP